jgi:hypothetical protein
MILSLMSLAESGRRPQTHRPPRTDPYQADHRPQIFTSPIAALLKDPSKHAIIESIDERGRFDSDHGAWKAAVSFVVVRNEGKGIDCAYRVMQ